MEVPGEAAIISSHICPQTLVPPVVCLRLDLYLALYLFLQGRGDASVLLDDEDDESLVGPHPGTRHAAAHSRWVYSAKH